MDKVKMAIVGAGIWGENHASIYKAHPFAEIVAICDQNEGKAKEVAQRCGHREGLYRLPQNV